MAKLSNQTSPQNFVKSLIKEGHLSDQVKEKAEDLLNRGQDRIPVFLQIFAGLGAFLSAIPFFMFLFASEILNFNSLAGLLVFGLVLIGMAIPIGRANKIPTNIMGVYLQQVSLILMGTGKVLAIIGASDLFPFSDTWNAVIMIFALAGLTYHFFGSSVDRFLSVLIALISVPIAIATDRGFEPETQGLLLNGYFVLQIALLAFLSMKDRLTALYTPLYYAVIFSLANVVLKLSASSTLADLFGIGFYYNIYLVSALLGAGFMALVYLSSNKLKTLKTDQLVVLSIGVLALTLLPAPGVLFALILLFLGYRDYNSYFTTIGLGFLAYFIFHFYYDLKLSLLMKSIILMGSGALMLVGYFVMHLRKWHGEK